ncbi:divalent-cation tolerance protein CutA [Candidatus Methylomicrobium oryzae]|jgi:periplasmic divalent cation tolerance protein|uniref:divalent-cation tolerance protein CutA n=1 Tax=Candidatus Methylomicrobium oryzae TaxID=2802053 RepID=UPI0019236190|nr:divalent-cation tolerance protein CutA [Methylomicrobium sp. RS1]MBL1262527.1 divalent-cation tolerance protein CutA [Methylomicrobium sp. RS1]
MPNDAQLILCTCPDRETAEKIAHRLVESRLAACVNILPGLTSIYTWENRLETAEEHLLLIKTAGGRYPDVEQSIREQHPYDLPEIIALPIARGLPGYLNWIDACVSTD